MSIDIASQTTEASLSQRVAEEIRVAMLRRRITGVRLAKALGVSAAWVSYRLNGLQPIDLNDLERIASALGVKVADLFPRRDREVTVTSLPLPVDHGPGRPILGGRPSGGRPPGRTDRHRPPASPRRTSRVPRPLTA